MEERIQTSQIETHAESEPMWRNALWGRLSRGLEHRLNNLETILLAAEDLLTVEPHDDDISGDVRVLVEGARDAVAMLGELVAVRGVHRTTDLSVLCRALSSVLSSINHRVTFVTELNDSAVQTSMELPAARHATVLAGLCAHSALTDAGSIALTCTASPIPEIVFVARPRIPHAGFGVRFRTNHERDWQEIHTALAQHGGSFTAEATDGRITMRLRFPLATRATDR